MPIDPVVYEYIASEVECPANEVIIEEGSKGDWVYVVLEGHVKVKKRTPKGLIVIDTLSEGDIFGEIAFLEGEDADRSATVMAAEGSVRLGILDKELLIKHYSAMSPTLRAIIKSLAIKVRETTKRICTALVAAK
ncbi:MAG: cyclic nucleotide-binding domain-containing protein [Deltaproteobacteria bacterium]|jgi:CRP-like cAMP-binding protein|nr:cyclic nucleotide-binding domain-containing protein [Deltaproteobacteria bacterium]